MTEKYDIIIRKLGLALCVIMTVISISAALSQSLCIKAYEYTDNSYLYDGADLLDDQQEAEFNEAAAKFKEKNGFSVYVYIDNAYMTDYENAAAAEEIYDKGYSDGTIDKKCFILYYDAGNRYYCIDGYANDDTSSWMEKDSTSEDIKEYIFDDMHYNDNYDAFMKYIDRVNYWIDYVPVIERWYVQLLIALVIGAVVAVSLVAGAGGKNTVTSVTYLANRDNAVTARRDEYIRTAVTRVRHVESSSSGGGGSHISAGGHSHSHSGGHC
jgi:uncharacterized protein